MGEKRWSQWPETLPALINDQVLKGVYCVEFFSKIFNLRKDKGYIHNCS